MNFGISDIKGQGEKIDVCGGLLLSSLIAESVSCNCMKSQSFRVFKKEFKFFNNPIPIILIAVWSVFFIAGFSGILSGVSRQAGAIIFGSIVALTLAYLFSNFFRYRKPGGEFIGDIAFEMDRIKIINNSIPLDAIEKIDFNYCEDYRGKSIYSYNSITPRLSAGIDNICQIKTKNQEEYEVNFLQTNANRIENTKELLIYYHSLDKISLRTLVKVLKADNYKKVQELKKEIKNAASTR